MAKSNTALLAFNRGLVSPRGLSRTDLARMALSAEVQTNYIPRVLGSMMLRPGLGYKGATKSNAYARHIPFLYAIDDTAILEMTDSVMRVRVDEAIISRSSVSTAFTNGTFDSDLAGWADADETSATSDWLTGGYMSLTGSGYSAAIRTQTLTVSGGDQGVEHGIRIVVTEGRATLRIGSTSGGDEYINETTLGIGTHSLAITPTGSSVYVRLSNDRKARALVTSIAVEASGDMEIPTPWSTDANLNDLRWDQSGDVVFIACDGIQQRKIERRGARSWSIVVYSPDDGPYRIENLTSTTITPSALSGNVTLTASRALFRASHVGALFKIQSAGQQVTAALSGEGQASDSIRVTGVGAANAFTFSITGTWIGTVTLQYSLNEEGSWVNQTNFTNANASDTFDTNASFDNLVCYWRLIIRSGNYTSGTANVSLTFSGGGISGVARVTSVTNATTATASVLTAFGGTGASNVWSEGAWSNYRGWPTCCAFHEGRLWWAGRDSIWGSYSDAFESMAATERDGSTIGDSNAISRTIGSGPVDKINWLSSGKRLFLGAQGAEKNILSSSLDEPVTPNNFNLKDISTQGSLSVAPVKIDVSTIFAQRSGRRVYEIAPDKSSYDFNTNDLMGLVPDLISDSIVAMGVQRQPDTRVHVVRSNGTVALLVIDRVENVVCWVEVDTPGASGEVEDVFVLPADGEDAVYYIVKRTIDGGTVRYLERWANETSCQGGALNYQADSYILYDGSATDTITGLDHLEGEEVIVWADGADLSPGVGVDQTTYTVASGSITLGVDVEQAIVGLPYKAQFKSRKLIEGAPKGVGLTQRKRVDHLALNLVNTHAQGLRYGPDFTNMDSLPLYEDYDAVDQDSIWDVYDKDSIEFEGVWGTDSRVCLESNAPRPATITALVISSELHEKS